MKTRIIPVAVGGLLGMSAAWADLLIHENFDYESGTVDGVESTATGLTGQWVVSGHPNGNPPMGDALFDSLFFERHFEPDGGALQISNSDGGTPQDWSELGASVPVTADLNVPVLWTSTIIQFSAPGGIGGPYYDDWRVEQRLNLASNSGATTSALRVAGRMNGSGTTATGRAAIGADHGATSEGTGTIAPATNYLFVTKTLIDGGNITGSTLYVFSEEAYGAFLAQAYVNPEAAETFLDSTASLILTDADTDTANPSEDITTKAVLQFSIQGGPIGAFDDVRFGTTIGDVVNLEAPPTFETALSSAQLNFTGGTIVIADVETAEVDAAALDDFLLELNGEVMEVTVAKEGGLTTISFEAPIEASGIYDYYLEVPRVDGDDLDIFFGPLDAYKLPLDLPGAEGTVGTWSIREYYNPPLGNPDMVPVAGNIAAAVDIAVAAAEGSFVEETDVPVLNHSDPDTNGAGARGNFNNDFTILTDNAGEDDGWVVVAKTKLNITEAGARTFSIHSDDGFVLRISGGAGGRFTAAHGYEAGRSVIDPGDNQTIFFNDGTGDSNTRGVYEFDGPGVYDVTFLSWDGGGGGYYEMAWTEGEFVADRDTTTWSLVGSPGDASIPAYQERFVAELPGPPATEGNFSIRTYLGAMDVGNIGQASEFVRTTTRQPSDADGLTIDSYRPVLNAMDPQTGGGGAITPDEPFPGNTDVDNDNVVTVAKGRINVPTTQTYTFWAQGDDGFLLRLKGVNGTSDPSFERATQGGNAAPGRFEMSNLNELFFQDGTGNSDTRGIITLQAGSYDLEYIHWEGGGGFYYELAAAPGAWPHGTTPPTGWQLVGFVPPSDQVIVPGIAEPGWTVESANPDRAEYAFNIAGAEAAIDAALADDTVAAAKVSQWDVLNFTDPQAGNEGSFPGSNPWPLDTTNDDNNYAMRATGTLVITSPGTYHLGFQGDDGGYMQIDGPIGAATPTAEWSSIVSTNHAPEAMIVQGDSGSGLNNRLQVEVGTGNSRTVGSIDLEVGSYTIKTLVYEGGGGSWWEVFGAKTPVSPFYTYPLLAKGEGEVVTVQPGLQLVAQEPGEGTPPGTRIGVSSFSVAGAPVTSTTLSFASEAGRTYKVLASVDLVNWFEVEAAVPASGAGTTTHTVDVATIPALSDEPKVFFRVVIN